MLTVHQLAKSFALKTLFENVTFSINTGDRVGLVGPNGCGKTTLLRAITGEVQADSGHVTRNNGLRVGYLSQGFEYSARETISEVVGKASGDVEFLESELTILSTALADKPDDRDLQYRYDALLHKIVLSNKARQMCILAGLDLDKVPAKTPVEFLSGGQQTRLNLALVQMDDPQLLLLDEPTNHLDIGMLEWLENWLSAFHGGALIVSHDRIFLDNSVNRVLAIDPLRKELREFAGNYSAYREQIRLERNKQWELYRDQQQEERRIKQDILRAKAQAAYTERQASSVRIGGEMMKLKGYKDYQQGIAKKVAKKAKSRERKLDRFLDSDDRVDKPRQSHDIRLDFSETERLGRSVVTVSDLCAGYDGQDPLLDGLNLEAKPGARIVLAGPNGSGKTTFLKTLTGQIPAQSGNVIVGPSVKLGFMTQDQADIDLESTPLGSLRHAFANETKTRTYLGYFLFVGDEALLDNRSLSFGQRARLALAQLVASGCNVLLLAEPINHLDIPAREKFEEALSGFSGTIIAVIHDRFFIDRFATEIWEVRDRDIRRVLR